MNVVKFLSQQFITLNLFVTVVSVSVKYLTEAPHKIPSKQLPELVTFCYVGKPKSVLYLWQSVYVDLDLPPENYNYYEGSTADIVYKEYLEQHSSWILNMFALKRKSIKLDPFNQTCIGIETVKEYECSLQVVRIDYWKVLCLVLGVLLFFTADPLSRNALFYYICGVSFGICASFLILIYFFSKLFPKVFRLDGNEWVTPIADQLQVGISHLMDYLRSETYRILYGRYLTNKPEIPPPCIDKAKKVSRIR